MPSPLRFLHHKSASTPVPAAPDRSATTYSAPFKDPNSTDRGLLLSQKCVYERAVPGNSYITAHITRLQSGYYDSSKVHGDRINNVRFVAIRFVFHPTDDSHRFISAKIKLAVHDRRQKPHVGIPLPPQINHPDNSTEVVGADGVRKMKPRFLRHAPVILYGSLSPETLDWSFNLAGSLGVSLAGASASINPEYGVKSSYKVYRMMKIQGSVRSLNSWYGHRYDVEDGELVWTLEENALQKSGLPREFTFVIMLTKGDCEDCGFELEVEPVVASWYGAYPKWWLSRIWYQPMHKPFINLDEEIGQKFTPCSKTEGFNFADLMNTFEDFVTLPGTTYTKAAPVAPDSSKTPADAASGDKNNAQLTASPVSKDDKHYNINVFLKGHQDSDSSSRSATPLPISISTRTPAQINSGSPAPDSGFSMSKSRNHRRRYSEVPQSSSPAARTQASPRPRPVSAIYEVSATPVSAPDHAYDDSRQNRRHSIQTDISEDLFADPYVQDYHPSAVRPSRSLRHSRPVSGLQDEFDQSSTAYQSTRMEREDRPIVPQPQRQPQQRQQQQQPLPSQSKRQNDRPSTSAGRTSSSLNPNRRHSIQAPPAAPPPPISAPPTLSTTPTSKAPLQPPPLVSPRKRDPAMPPARHSRTSSTAAQPSSFQAPAPPQSALPPPAVTQQNLPSRYNYHSEIPATLVDDSPTIGRASIPVFPPTSYPAYAPTRAVDNNPELSDEDDEYPSTRRNTNTIHIASSSVSDPSRQTSQSYQNLYNHPVPYPPPTDTNQHPILKNGSITPLNPPQAFPLTTVPSASSSAPPLKDVDGLVQREVSNYLRNHPELYHPASEYSTSRSKQGSPINSNSPSQHQHLSSSQQQQGNGDPRFPLQHRDRDRGGGAYTAPAGTTQPERGGTYALVENKMLTKLGSASASASASAPGSGSGSGSGNVGGDVSSSGNGNTATGGGGGGGGGGSRSGRNRRITSPRSTSGEFVKVNGGSGVGSGGWEYLE